MKFKTALAAVAAMTLTGTAYAQVGPEVGATVYEAPNGEIGGVIGTIETIENDTVLVDVDGMDAPLPLAAFGEGPDGPVIAATKAQIVQMLQQAQAQATAARDQALVADAPVMTANSVPVGKIESVEGDNIVLALPEGSVALVRTNFTADANGSLMVLYTKAQLLAALNGEDMPEGEAMAEGTAEGGEMAADAE